MPESKTTCPIHLSQKSYDEMSTRIGRLENTLDQIKGKCEIGVSCYDNKPDVRKCFSILIEECEKGLHHE